jgi:glycerophosphoryl diester phosphodiesterase
MKPILPILALIAFPVTLAGATEPTFDLQAHRGGKSLCPPGNILPAFRKALDLEVTTLELDTHITRDGKIIIIHDPGVLEKAVKKPPQSHGYRIRKHALSEIKQYVIRAGDGKTATVPTLEEFFLFLKAYPDEAGTSAGARDNARAIRLNIETKEEGYEKQLVALIKSHGLEKRTTIQSFKMASIVKVKRLSRVLRTSALSQSLEEATAVQADYWSPEYPELNAALVKKAHAAGLKVVPWTCNAKEDMARLIGLGVDGIITDNPPALIEVLQKSGIKF